MIEYINQTWSTAQWSPIYRLTEAFTPAQIRSFFHASIGCIIASAADGLNLVAKEYCATNRGKGVLLLSKFAGAHAQLQDFVLTLKVYETEAMADQILEALHLDLATKKEMAERAHAQLEQDTILAWWEKWGAVSGLVRNDRAA
jgi:trehalose 6-phosphate synthase